MSNSVHKEKIEKEDSGRIPKRKSSMPVSDYSNSPKRPYNLSASLISRIKVNS